MKPLVAALFGFQILVGNICMMNVAYAAPETEHAAMGHEQHAAVEPMSSSHSCMEQVCMESASDVSHDMSQADCATGDCIMAEADQKVADRSSVQTIPGAPSFVRSLLLQYLLVTGPPPSPPGDLGRTEHFHTLTVVMRR